METAEQGPGTYLYDYVGDYFLRVADIAGTLTAMAAQQREGIPFTEDQMAFVNDAVYLGGMMGCRIQETRVTDHQRAMTTPDGTPYGWYTDLFIDPFFSIERDPTVADVHTQPADEAGRTVGRILHLATGEPRLMAVTIDTCTGPRAYMGPVFSYFETITEDFLRLTDEEWADALAVETPTDVPWMKDLVVR